MHTSNRRPWAARELHSDVRQAALNDGMTPLQATLIAGRIKQLPDCPLPTLIAPSIRDIPRASNLPDIGAAADAICDAIVRDDVLGVVVDHDCDGCTSGSVILKALTESFGVPPSRVTVIPSHRLKEGYGVSTKLVERILGLEPRPTLLISADQGSADQPRIAQLLEHGIRTVVTDHHHIPVEGPPKSAVACVNPARDDSEFGDASIAGCLVAWYVMLAVQHGLRERGVTLPMNSLHLNELLSYVAVGTCADAVDLGTSKANRWAVQTGLNQIKLGRQPIWEAFAPFVRGEWTSTSIAFQVASRVNSAGRLGDASRSIEAMCASDLKSAHAWVRVLDETNTKRKDIQKDLGLRAMEMAWPMVEQGAPALCIPFYVGGHAGVHGVIASRVLDATGLPTVCLSSAEGDGDMMTGSIRSVEGAHVKNLLDEIRLLHPEFQLMGGGHAMAGGIRILRCHVPAFAVAWERVVAKALKGSEPPLREHDGELPCPPSCQVIDEIEALQPFGRGFPEPTFVADVEVLRVSALGKDGKHCSLDVAYPGGQLVRAVWFGSVGSDGALPQVRGRRHLIYEIRRSSFSRGPGYDIHVKDIT